jgi:PTS system mannose-specific IIC component
MTLGPAEVAILALLGGALALDGTSVGQFMVSRPLVACTLAGWAVGAPALGAALGAVLEALHIAVLPVGAARYPEGAPAAVAAAGVYAGLDGREPLLLAVVLFALAWEWVGDWTVNRLRAANVALAVPAPGSAVDPRWITRRHLAAITLDFVRGALLTAAGIGVLLGVAALVPEDGFPLGWGVRAAHLGAALAAASAIRLFGTGRMKWFAAGAAAGVVLLLAR